MGARAACVAVCRLVAPVLIVFGTLSGCQLGQLPSGEKFIDHREQLDFSGLHQPEAIDELKINASLPNGWQALPRQKGVLYTHQQFRSPSRKTAVGITYARLPLPLSSKTLVWFVSREAAKRSVEGKVLRRWSDELGREWFEAETDKYHVIGYVLARGSDAWINYVGYRLYESMDTQELALASRSLDSLVPEGLAPRFTQTAAVSTEPLDAN